MLPSIHRSIPKDHPPTHPRRVVSSDPLETRAELSLIRSASPGQSRLPPPIKPRQQPPLIPTASRFSSACGHGVPYVRTLIIPRWGLLISVDPCRSIEPQGEHFPICTLRENPLGLSWGGVSRHHALIYVGQHVHTCIHAYPRRARAKSYLCPPPRMAG